MTAIGQALSAALIHFVWQGLAVAGVLWMVLLLLRKSSAHSRYVASCAALAALAATPVITAWAVYARPAAVAAGFRGLVSRVAVAAGSGVAPRWGSFELWVLRLWAVGVLVFSLRLVWSSRHVYQLRRTGTPAEAGLVRVVSGLVDRMGVSRVVRVLISPLADTPSVVGWLRPVILIPPACLMGLTAEQLETVIAHELAHILRHDYLVNMLQSVVEALLFYHPAVWWISARIRRERELCCDDMVVASCGDALGYARALTSLERLRVGQQTLALGSTDGALSYRVRRLLGDVVTDRQGPSRMAGILVLCLGIVCLALPVSRARLQAQPMPANAWSGIETVTTQGASMVHGYPFVYTEESLSDQARETVSVEVTLDAGGNVSDARVLAGSMQLRASVLASVLHWQFVPEGAGATGIITILFPTRSAAQVAAANQQAIVRAFVSDEISAARAAWQAARQKNAQDGPDKALFDQAIRSIERGDYGGARLTLNSLINTYDHSAFLPEAKLAIAESWAREGGIHGVQQAGAEFQDFTRFYGSTPPGR
jgi:beta-lactamase regulating signal transducer with metallopeptidase domain